MSATSTVSSSSTSLAACRHALDHLSSPTQTRSFGRLKGLSARATTSRTSSDVYISSFAYDRYLAAGKTAAVGHIAGVTLINEGIVALSLISTHAGGGTLVLDSLLNPLPSEAIRSSSTSQPLSAVSASEGSPVVGPRHALDMLIGTLREGSAPNVPPEVRSNVCALLGHLGRKGVVSESRTTDVQRMTESTRGLMEMLAKEEGHRSNPKVAAAAKRALEAWA
ncbi:hypothetical protein LXA43DRAFT_1116106 [Ganoderma leucocontextum]|nr:hypothetical protein LXA43DRAFT_1116106 [Ganoderma leucocontextum]